MLSLASIDQSGRQVNGIWGWKLGRLAGCRFSSAPKVCAITSLSKVAPIDELLRMTAFPAWCCAMPCFCLSLSCKGMRQRYACHL